MVSVENGSCRWEKKGGNMTPFILGRGKCFNVIET